MEIGNTNIPDKDETTIITTDEVVIPFVFEMSYKGDELTRRCADIINMPDITGWKVIDTDENLALVHYNPKTDFQKFGHIRGLILDTENGDMICDSFGYTPIAVCDEITPINDEVVITDQDGITHKFLLTDPGVSVERILEGVMLNITWCNNKMRISTHKKINPTKSKWGNSKKFIDIYKESNGPTAEQLFDTTKPHSSTCYHFIGVDGSLLVATRQKVNVPYLVYIDRQEMCLNKPESDIAIGVPTFPTIDNISGTVNVSGIYKPRSLNINQANRYLKYGYYKAHDASDKRELNGESVIFYKKVDEVIVDVVKVNSTSYEWRSNIRGGNHNVVNQFYAKLNMVYSEIKEESQWARFKSNLILFPLYSVDVMKALFHQGKGLLSLTDLEVDFTPTKEMYATRQSRIQLFWINYVLSLPISHQEAALELLDNFIADRNSLIEWLGTLGENVKTVMEPDYDANIVRIISSARREAKKSAKDGTNLTKTGEVLSYKATIRRKIYQLIDKERGKSLYAMIREMKQRPSLSKKV